MWIVHETLPGFEFNSQKCLVELIFLSFGVGLCAYLHSQAANGKALSLLYGQYGFRAFAFIGLILLFTFTFSLIARVVIIRTFEFNWLLVVPILIASTSTGAWVGMWLTKRYVRKHSKLHDSNS